MPGGGAPADQRVGAPRPSPGPQPTTIPSRNDPMTDPGKDPLSTFALDVDTGSYTRFRDATLQGRPVSAAGVRTEEFVNYFEQEYAAPADGLAVSVDGARLPFDESRRVVRVGVRSPDLADAERPDVNLELVVDCSGSMSEAGKMATTKQALGVLVRALRPADRVGMVCYSTTARVLLAPTPVSERDAILAAIDTLQPEASTNVAAGLDLGFAQARTMPAEGRLTRVVLISDGVANVGATSPAAILDRVGASAREGISLISIGVGIADYNDLLLEQLADKGEGWHAYVDSPAEAERIFARRLTSSLVIAARQAKVQVSFDASRVAAYRLVGYENRAVADRDFRNDAVDGGEVFVGRSATALYEVVLREGAGDGPIATATVRYQLPGGSTAERVAGLASKDTTRALDAAPRRLHQDVVVALVADRLAGGPWSRRTTLADLSAQTAAVTARIDGDRDVAELASLVGRLR
ncbi:MAG TPA: von Willebrand factor type A domain-containing protein [Dermatophilaceae bacterium]|nr:von Willebrand factor type A domain-containing protein [Dermatophilaceae bacterium]